MKTTIKAPERDAKIREIDGELLLYIGKVAVDGDTTTIVPCRNITDRNLCTLKEVDDWGPRLRRSHPEAWERLRHELADRLDPFGLGAIGLGVVHPLRRFWHLGAWVVSY